MFSNSDNGAPRTAPHLAGVILLAVGLIIAFHVMGFHFVVAGGVG